MVFDNISFRDKFGEERKLEFNNFYCVDCMEVLKLMPDKSIDLCIVDPPYGISITDSGRLWKYNKNGNSIMQSSKSATISKDYGKKNWDSNIPDKEYFDELFRVSKNQIIWGVNYYNNYDLSGGRIYWDKCVTMPTYSNGELAYCSLINSIKSITIAWHGMIQQDMKNKENRIHPTQKPVALYEWLLKNYAKAGDKILDTHLGSASSVIACKKLGFEYIGFELDEDYYNAASKRIADFEAQLSIFDLPEVEIHKQDSFLS